MSTTTPSDLDLLNLAYRHARRMGLIREDAQDCAQDFLLRIYGQGSLQRESPAWLNRCAHNFACNYLRGLARRRASERSAVESACALGRRSGLGRTAASGPRTLVMRRDFWTRVRALLRVFTADQQELFLRYHVRQQSLMDLAERDGRSLHALHQSLHNVHRRLARLLIEQGWDAAEVRQLFGAPTPQPVSRPRTCGNPPSQL